MIKKTIMEENTHYLVNIIFHQHIKSNPMWPKNSLKMIIYIYQSVNILFSEKKFFILELIASQISYLE